LRMRLAYDLRAARKNESNSKFAVSSSKDCPSDPQEPAGG
jgi:hypothetical protein